jgi:hypothetical protein
MSFVFRFAVAAAFLVSGGTAHADWQFTKWGMSSAELTALSEHIKPTTAVERQGHSNPYIGSAHYRSAYAAADIKFTAYYWFDAAGKLVTVELTPVDLEDGPKPNLTLEQVYGAPIEDKSRQMSGGTMFCTVLDRKWRSEKEKNIVRVSGLRCNGNNGRDFFSVRYEPILSAGSTGLWWP